MRCNWALLGVWLVGGLPLAQGVVNTALGTTNGYDVGGNASICYVSYIAKDPNATDTDGSNYTAIELLNDGLFDAQPTDEGAVTLLPSCFPGTQMEVVPLDLAANRQLLTGRNHTFRLSLQADVSVMDPNIAVQALHGKSTIFFRLLLCDAIQKGFCDPLIDSRDMDAALQPYQTDVGAPKEQEFPPGPARWIYKEDTTLRGLQPEGGGGVLVFSRWCRWSLRQVTPQNPLFTTAVNITLQLPATGVRAGAYFFIGHAVLNFDVGDQAWQRVDVAAAIPNNVVEIRNPPVIQTVTDAMIIGLAVAIGIFGAIALAMLLYLIRQRNHAVMRLAQGSFLAAIAGACCLQITGSFAFLPTQDVFCRLQGPLVFIPMTFVAACLVGRIWRVYKVLSVMNQFARLEATPARTCSGDSLIFALSCLAQMPLYCFPKRSSSSAAPPSSSLRLSHRQTVSAEETASLIGVLTIPQVLVQVLASALVPDWGLVEELESSGNVGRIVCSANGDWVLATGMAYTAAVYMLAVVVAWISRTLPSAFNEKVQIFHAATISTLLAFVTISLVSISSDPTTHPDIQVFLRSLLAIGVAACVLFLIVWPKILRVWSGEKVVMSTYLGTEKTSSQPPSQSMAPPPLSSASSGRDLSAYDADPTTNAAQESSPEVEPVTMRYSLKKDDPLPAAVESKILRSESLLKGVTNKFCEGRPLLAADVSTLQREIASLHDELNRIDYDEEELPDGRVETKQVAFASEEYVI